MGKPLRPPGSRPQNVALAAAIGAYDIGDWHTPFYAHFMHFCVGKANASGALASMEITTATGRSRCGNPAGPKRIVMQCD
jgi:hypothetical protein